MSVFPNDDGLFDEENSLEEETFSASVCCNVHGFVPYFYALPIGNLSNLANEKEYWSSSKADGFIKQLNYKVKMQILQDISCNEYHEFVTNNNNKCIIGLEVLKTADVRDKIYLFYENSSSAVAKSLSNTVVLKIYCSLPRFCWKAHKVLEDQSMMYDECKFQCFETNINNNIRFLTDQNIPGCSWLELMPGKYFQRNDSPLNEYPTKESHCQIEIDVHMDNINKMPDEHPRYKSNPSVRVLSFDIEVMVSPDDLNSPKDGHRQVIQIGNVLGNYCGGRNTDAVTHKAVFVLGTCEPIQDAKVIQFYIKENRNATDEEFLKDAEAAMLGAWRDFVIQMDPDIIIGYNIKKFDIPYLIDRAEVLSNHKSSRLPFLGRMKKMRSQIRPVENYLKKVHPYDEKNVDIQGRVILDLYPILFRHDRRNNGKGYFKLCNVAKRYLAKKEEKQDVNYKEIEGLQRGTSTTRQRLAHYCLQDSMIPFLLLYAPVPCRTETIGLIELYFKKSNTGGNILRYLLNKSMSYNDYFKQIRMQKNPGVIPTPDTPSPKKFMSNRNNTRHCAKNLFNSPTSSKHGSQ